MDSCPNNAKQNKSCSSDSNTSSQVLEPQYDSDKTITAMSVCLVGVLDEEGKVQHGNDDEEVDETSSLIIRQGDDNTKQANNSRILVVSHHSVGNVGSAGGTCNNNELDDNVILVRGVGALLSSSSSPEGRGVGETLSTCTFPTPATMSLLQVQRQGQLYYADVCRICHCGPNTLATPTPQVLTPVTSPRKAKLQRIQTQQQTTNNPLIQSSITPTLTTPTSSPTAVIISIQTRSSTPPSPQPLLPSTIATNYSPPAHHIHSQQSSPSSTPLQTVINSSAPPSPQPYRRKDQAPLPPPTQDYNLISPCVCSGSLKYVHQCCLQHWIRASNNTSCELCKHPYELRSRFKPIWNWESLPMSSREKKRVACSALFHTVALACVIWSLYVLIDRTIEELTHSDLEWQFWTKIVVEAIGCLGAGILTYVWGKSYVCLFIKWISFNRSFVILGKEHRNSIPSTIVLEQQPETVISTVATAILQPEQPTTTEPLIVTEQQPIATITTSNNIKQNPVQQPALLSSSDT